MAPKERLVSVLYLDSVEPIPRQGTPDGDVEVHDVTVARRIRTVETTWGQRRVYYQTRYECMCGFATEWCSQRDRATAQLQAHVTRGQLVMPVVGL